VNRHQVVGLAPGVRELGFQEVFEALVAQPPVPLVPYLAEILPQLGEPLVSLLVDPLISILSIGPL